MLSWAEVSWSVAVHLDRAQQVDNVRCLHHLLLYGDCFVISVFTNVPVRAAVWREAETLRTFHPDDTYTEFRHGEMPHLPAAGSNETRTHPTQVLGDGIGQRWARSEVLVP